MKGGEQYKWLEVEDPEFTLEVVWRAYTNWKIVSEAERENPIKDDLCFFGMS